MLTMGARGGYVSAGRGGRGGNSKVVIQLVLDSKVVSQIVDRNLHYGLGIAAQTGLAT